MARSLLEESRDWVRPRAGVNAVQKKISATPRIEPHFSGVPARSLVTVLNELHHLPGSIVLFPLVISRIGYSFVRTSFLAFAICSVYTSP
jgi:hypothetical protein